jgi:pantoate--beta-alanine ligase
MGALHQGHLSLVRQARQRVKSTGKVVVSIYVNPTQFGPGEDFNKYPRDFRKDAVLCRQEGVDVIFAPTDDAMYPGSDVDRFSTFVVEESLSKGMEGAARPTHFRGVCTVVAKLFNIVDPDFAVFGQKDIQQAAVVQRMVRDLNFRVKIIVAPTVREPDDLAMSSRNKYLSSDERPQASVLWKAIELAKQRVRSNQKGLPVLELKHEIQRLIEERPAARVDYISFFDPVRLQPVEIATRGTQLALAVYIGRTRLIDNAEL